MHMFSAYHHPNRTWSSSDAAASLRFLITKSFHVTALEMRRQKEGYLLMVRKRRFRMMSVVRGSDEMVELHIGFPLW